VTFQSDAFLESPVVLGPISVDAYSILVFKAFGKFLLPDFGSSLAIATQWTSCIHREFDISVVLEVNYLFALFVNLWSEGDSFIHND
jgi:hypothetical protein